ncbi:MAG: TIGR04282 family arsenosugar biosynthesis glycosyltransferase [Pseudomonadales bacterium]
MIDLLSEKRVLVFAKAPVLGEVKTRLQPWVDQAQSVLIHRAMVKHTMNRLVDSMAAAVVDTIELWAGSTHPWWQELAKEYGVAVFQQQGSALGERMCNAGSDALQRSSSVLIIGTDCPYITLDYLRRALVVLEENDCVLGPAEDGGYVLIGLKQAQPDIFAGVNWGSEKVLDQTRARLQQLRLAWGELEVLSDIDRPEDLQKLFSVMPALASEFDVELMAGV